MEPNIYEGKKKVFKNKLLQFPFNLHLNEGNSYKQILGGEGAMLQHKFKLRIAFFINFHFLHDMSAMYTASSNLKKAQLSAAVLFASNLRDQNQFLSNRTFFDFFYPILCKNAIFVMHNFRHFHICFHQIKTLKFPLSF